MPLFHVEGRNEEEKKNRLRGQTVVERVEVVRPGDHLRLATATAKEASRKKVADRYNMLARRIEVLFMVVKS